MKKLTNIEFINECQKIHNNKYDYSLISYINAKTKIDIICPEHGIFTQEAFSHKGGQGCSKCSNNCKMTTIEFVEKSNKIHINKYDYSLVEYNGNKNKIKIICQEHGVFEQTCNNHLKGQGCPKCKRIKIDNFLTISNNTHSNKYDYSLVDLNKRMIKIICPEHGEFYQDIYNHMKGHGCTKCKNLYNYDTTEFIKKAIFIHNDKYDYSLVDYKDAKTKIKLKCKIHNFEFVQTPNNHLHGQGCPKCKNSIGENRISSILNRFEIKYIQQKTFDDCKYKNVLPFDFYLPKFNTCIEFDGIQHFKEIEYFGGKEAYIETKIRDNIKNEYCEEHNIKLIRIKYDQNINEISMKKLIKYEKI